MLITLAFNSTAVTQINHESRIVWVIGENSSI